MVSDPGTSLLLISSLLAPLAAAEIEIATSNANAPTVLRVVECTPQVHHICVCTLCSCYPSGLLGISPSWYSLSLLSHPSVLVSSFRYRSRSYRARTVREPRKVLESFGTYLPKDVEIQVHDSTADCRFLVLPLRPKGTENWTAEQLRAIVTRDSMIGVSVLSL